MQHGKDLSRLERGTGVAVATHGDGFCARGSLGAFCARHGTRAAGFVGDSLSLRAGRERLSALPSGHDDGVAVVRLLPRHLLLSPAGPRLRGTLGWRATS
jgi:hypothetical protein